MYKTLIAFIGILDKTQKELVKCLISQVYENTDCTIVDFMENNLFGVNVPDGYKLSKPKQWQYGTWRQMCNRYKMFIRPYDNIIIIGTPLYVGDKFLSLELLRKTSVKITKNPKIFIDNPSYRGIFERLVFVRGCIGKNVIQYCIDSREVDFSRVWKLEKYVRVGPVDFEGIKYFPMYEWAMKTTYCQPIQKVKDIFFMGTANDKYKRDLLTKFVDASRNKFGRKITYGTQEAMKRPLLGVFEICGDGERLDIVSQQEYLYNLMLSRYTVIFPPYNQNCFNIVRFIEAVICNCIPLVFQHENLKWLKLTFPDIYTVIQKNNLIIKKTRTKIPEEWIWTRIRLQYQDGSVIEEIKSTKSFKNIVDRKYVNERLTSLLSG